MPASVPEAYTNPACLQVPLRGSALEYKLIAWFPPFISYVFHFTSGLRKLVEAIVQLAPDIKEKLCSVARETAALPGV